MPRRAPRDLRIDAVAARQAVRRNVARRMEFEGLSYVRFSGKAGFERGSVFVEGRAVPPYPSVGRIFVLEAGVRRNLPGPFAVEEKIDGYKVRILRAGGRSWRSSTAPSGSSGRPAWSPRSSGSG